MKAGKGSPAKYMKKIVCIGDSLTYGYGVQKDKRWTEGIESLDECEMINKGVNGDTTVGMLSRSHRDVLAVKPTHVIIMAGTNDFLCGRNVRSVMGNIVLLVKEAREYGIIPIIAAPIPVCESMAAILWDSGVNYSKVNDRLKAYHFLLKKFSERNNVLFIDFYDEFTSRVSEKNKYIYYMDGVHPTEKGHEVMTLKVMDALCKI